MPTWTSAFCFTNGIRVHYTRTGGPRPPLVLLHGLMTNGRCWTALARALADDYDVIMPDARGHGQSDVPAGGYRYDDHAADVAGFIEALGLGPSLLLGHSMGGMTAAVVGARYPQLLRGLVLADPTFLSPQMQQEVYASDVAAQHGQLLTRPLEEVIADGRARHPHRSAETIELFARARLQTSLRAFDVLTPPSPAYEPLVQALRVPTLLLTAANGIVSAAVAQQLQCLNPALRVEQLQRAGHVLQLDQPDQFTALVRAFFRSLT